MERNQAELNEFLSHPQVVELVPDAEVARIYAEMVVSLQKAGTPIPSNDVWIAATAKKAGVPVLTYDDHFLDIQQVNTLLLPTPPGKRQI
jgi:tRNA(fMet)-specific endonuclease VapC